MTLFDDLTAGGTPNVHENPELEGLRRRVAELEPDLRTALDRAEGVAIELRAELEQARRRPLEPDLRAALDRAEGVAIELRAELEQARRDLAEARDPADVDRVTGGEPTPEPTTAEVPEAPPGPTA